jgi:cyclic pyranopterin phosphate synthase
MNRINGKRISDMVNITHKNTTLRKAVATATLQVSKQETIDAIKMKQVPKGDVFEFSRAAGLLAVKKTSDVIPDCHPMPIEYTDIRHSIEGLSIIIEVEVHAIYRTGVEVEAMHGATVTALTMYDMLKPIDKSIEISTIKLLRKDGGKSNSKEEVGSELTCAVIVCSDTISKGESKDTSGKVAIERLKQYGLETVAYEIIPDEIQKIVARAKALSAANVDFYRWHWLIVTRRYT